ncbi:hypothetical protein [Variovorax sp. RCC_210]|uniref:phage tail terminator protein n=1 Tax=Variovorax sp. RCC_210 TaxID=3239217 RepID=UPI0035243127
MDLNLVIQQLRTFAPSFVGRFAGAAEFKKVSENTALPMPCGYVIPLEDNPGPPGALNAVRMDLTDSFAVVVCLDNSLDERGQQPATNLHFVRKELWKALLGWRPTLEYNGIHYEGGSLQQLDRAQLWYQFEFGAPMQIGPEDGWELSMLDALPKLNTVHTKVDVIDPIADKNLHYPGPDGRIEFETHVTNLNP